MFGHSQPVCGTSRGQNTYGYTTASLYDIDGRRVAACNGGGYDMRGTVVGNWIAATFADELRALKPDRMPEHSHWQSDDTRVCDGACKEQAENRFLAAVIQHGETKAEQLPRLPGDCFQCPTCHGPTRGSRDGKTVQDGRYFYGLCFSDPTYDVSKAKLEQADGTFTKPEDIGKTLGELKAAGKIVDLDAIRTWYKQTSKHATKRHTQPSIDGACGFSSVLEILRAIGLDLQSVCDRKNLDVYVINRAAGADRRRGYKGNRKVLAAS